MRTGNKGQTQKTQRRIREQIERMVSVINLRRKVKGGRGEHIFLLVKGMVSVRSSDAEQSSLVEMGMRSSEKHSGQLDRSLGPDSQLYATHVQ